MADPACMTAALAYANLGWRVLALSPGMKIPLKDSTLQPNGSTSASKDPAHIKQLWTQYPLAGVGIATGKESGLTVIDLDGPHAPALLKQHGLTPPETRTVKTPKGWHIYIQYDERIRQGAALFVADCNCAKKCQIDVRNDGGYVVAPPTVLA